MNLKPYLDAAVMADAEKQRLMNEIDAAFNLGTDEGEQTALELRPALDEAQAKAVEANKLYVSMRDAGQTSDEAALLFVPVSDPAAAASGDNPKVMNRQAFDGLAADEQAKFVKNGGRVEEESSSVFASYSSKHTKSESEKWHLQTR
jgi:hypothetical protein